MQCLVYKWKRKKHFCFAVFFFFFSSLQTLQDTLNHFFEHHSLLYTQALLHMKLICKKPTYPSMSRGHRGSHTCFDFLSKFIKVSGYQDKTTISIICSLLLFSLLLFFIIIYLFIYYFYYYYFYYYYFYYYYIYIYFFFFFFFFFGGVHFGFAG